MGCARACHGMSTWHGSAWFVPSPREASFKKQMDLKMGHTYTYGRWPILKFRRKRGGTKYCDIFAFAVGELRKLADVPKL